MKNKIIKGWIVTHKEHPLPMHVLEITNEGAVCGWENADGKISKTYPLGELSAYVPLIGEATEKQISDWKIKYPLGVYALPMGGKVAYFKHPDFNEMDAYHAKSEESESISDSWKMLAETCFLGGCEELRDSPKYLPTTHAKLKGLIFDYSATLVNL